MFRSSNLLKVAVRMSDVMHPFGIQVTREGTETPRNIYDGPPGNLFPGPLLSLTFLVSSNGTVMSCPFRCSKDNSLDEI